MKKVGIIRLAAVGIVIALGIVTVAQRQFLYDAWRLHNYSPPTAISQIATQVGMTDKARKIFYVTDPVIEDKETFNQHCSGVSSTEKTIVLGCYNGRNIYVFNVTDQRLDGVKQVTAAHEMLHAAYDRLSQKERDRVNELLNQQFKDMNDQRITDIISEYKKSEPNDVLNEMHSIFGTELATLNPELQDYYSQYFVDRTKVVEFAQKYENIFTQSKEQIAAIDDQLTGLNSQIVKSKETLEQRKSTLDAERAELNSLRGNPSAYNSRVAGFNASVDAYNELLGKVTSQIAEYNALVEKRNGLAAAANDLAQGLDSHVGEAQ